MRKTYFAKLIFILASSAFMSGCLFGGPKETQSGFLTDYSDLKKGVYFNREWIDPKADFSKYQNVKVAPVNLSYLDNKTSCDTNELEDLGTEFRKNIEQDLQKAGFTTTSNPAENTLIVSVALTNIETPQILQNLAVSAAGAFVPIPLPFDDDGKTAFEGKVTDGTTGKVLIQFSEVQEGSGESLNLKGMTLGSYTKFTNTKIIFSDWANHISKLLAELKAGKLTGKNRWTSGAGTLVKTAASVF
jgi:hypothetical protein